MATTYLRVLPGTTSLPQPVNFLTSVAAGPSVLGGSVLMEFSKDGLTSWTPWQYGTITQGGSFRPDGSGYVRVTATTAAANVFLCAMEGANGPNVTQLFNVNNTLASASSTAEQVLLSVRIPAGYLPANFALDMIIGATLSNNVNVKTLNVRWGGITGTVLFTAPLASFLNYNGYVMIRGRGDGSSVIGFGQGAGGGVGGSTVADPTVTRDYMNQETELVVTATKATAGDTFALESCLGKLF